METHLARLFFTNHPFLSNFEANFLETTKERVVMELAASEHFLESENQLHPGFATMILDTVMGGVVLGALDEPKPIATINLTCHHFGEMLAHMRFICEAKLLNREHDVAVVDGRFYESGTDGKTSGRNEFARAQGSFMIGTRAVSAKPDRSAK